MNTGSIMSSVYTISSNPAVGTESLQLQTPCARSMLSDCLLPLPHCLLLCKMNEQVAQLPEPASRRREQKHTSQTAGQSSAGLPACLPAHPVPTCRPAGQPASMPVVRQPGRLTASTQPASTQPSGSQRATNMQAKKQAASRQPNNTPSEAASRLQPSKHLRPVPRWPT